MHPEPLPPLRQFRLLDQFVMRRDDPCHWILVTGLDPIQTRNPFAPFGTKSTPRVLPVLVGSIEPPG
jgi:hypothetical protein